MRKKFRRIGKHLLIDFICFQADMFFMMIRSLRVSIFVLTAIIFLTAGCSHTSNRIMGSGAARVEDMSGFIVMNNAHLPKETANEIAEIYMEEANAESINPDVAFAQMCLETGFLNYGGQVLPGQNNFCGLGVFSSDTQGMSFDDMRIGIRAHIQHLKAYATRIDPVNDIVDPRFKCVKRGSAMYVQDLSGRWATDPRYGAKVDKIVWDLYEYKRKNIVNR